MEALEETEIIETEEILTDAPLTEEPVTDEEAPVSLEAPSVAPEEMSEQPDETHVQSEEPSAQPGDVSAVPEDIPTKKPFRLRAEHIMGVIAAFAGVLAVVMLILCWPYMRASEDPEALPQRHEAARATEKVVLQESVPEVTGEETEPTFPTIPPDPNPYDRYDFQYNKNNYLLLQNVVSYPGVDVSAYQGEIDWKRVAASGIDFAIIRLGYRGYESGKLVEDSYAVDNLAGAAEAGLRVGAYFFSQALNNQEVDEEIAFMLEILGDTQLDMPIVLDWEIPASSARTARMDARTLTNLQLHFCKVMEQKGYQPMVYFNWYQSEHLYYLSELEEFPFWLAMYQDRMTYPWKVEMWQYTSTGRVPGIAGDVDINVYMPY